MNQLELSAGNSNKRSVDSYSKMGRRFVMRGIRLYQLLLSPWIGRQCRFYPTCSHYTAEAVDVHGVLEGLRLGAVRIGKCHPFHPGGVDLVPQPSDRSPTAHS